MLSQSYLNDDSSVHQVRQICGFGFTARLGGFTTPADLTIHAFFTHFFGSTRTHGTRITNRTFRGAADKRPCLVHRNSDKTLPSLPQDQVDDGSKTLTFSQKVAKHDENFTKHVVRLLDSIQEIAEKDNAEKFVSLGNRINFNEYYSKLLHSRR